MDPLLPQIGKILYCTQLEPNAAYIFRYAYVLARKLGVRIVVLHVAQALKPSQGARVERHVVADAVHAAVEKEERGVPERLRRRIAAFCARAVHEDHCEEVVEKVIVARGRPHEEILRHAELEAAGLVVLGAHADSTLLGALLGNTAQKVIRRCPVPVLTVQVPEGRQELTLTE
jgi:nucleotide-binding universal stress UspA family protein